MRKIFWVVIAAFWLAVAGYFGYIYLHAPNKNAFYAIQGFVSIGRNYVNGEDVNLDAIKGNDNNADYLKALGTAFQSLSATERELSKQRRLLIVMVQPRNLSNTQSLDGSLQKIVDFQKLVTDSHSASEAAYQKLSADMSKVERNKKLMFDVQALIDSIKAEQPKREKKYSYYAGLAQYVKAAVEFAKARVGYFKMDDSGTSLVFTRPVDQDYYNKLISGIGAYSKQIDDDNAQDILVIRSQVGQAEALIAGRKK